jgi:membrane dipeptidase
MNKIGMVVDLSHSGQRTALDAIEASSNPLWISHSNCAAVHKHPRCATDEVIRAVAETGGVFGVTFWSVFVSDSDPASIEEVLRHVDHVAELVGPEFLAIGSDLDMHGYDSAEQYASRRESFRGTPTYRRQWDIPGLDNPHRMLNFSAALRSHGYSESEVAGIMGENARRVLRKVWIS